MGGTAKKTDVNNNNTKRIASNSLVLFARILLITAVNLYAVRLVLGGLGKVDYGIYNAVAGVVMTFSCLLAVLSVSVQRFYSYSVGADDEQQLPRIYSASINIIAVLSVVIVVLFETVGLWFVHHKLNIPIDRMPVVDWIFQCSVLSLVFMFVQIPFTAAVFAHEDMNVYALVSGMDCLLKLVAAMLIKAVVMDGLLFYCICLMGTSFITLCFYVFIARHRYKECHYVGTSDRRLYRELLSFSGWTLYGAFTGMTLIQGSVILVNMFFGPVATAAFGIANTIYNAFVSLTNTIVLAFRPRVIQSYASQAFDYLSMLFSMYNKALMFVLIIVAVPLVIEMEDVLKLWLGDCDVEMVRFSQLFVVYASLLSMHNPITTIMHATGNMKMYQLVVETLMVICLPLAYVLFRIGFPVETLFYTMIGCCVLAHCARVYCIGRYYSRFNSISYLRDLVQSGACVFVLTFLAGYFVHGMLDSGLLRIVLVSASSAVACLMFAYIVGLSGKERDSLISIMNGVIRR